MREMSRCTEEIFRKPRGLCRLREGEVKGNVQSSGLGDLAGQLLMHNKTPPNLVAKAIMLYCPSHVSRSAGVS